MGCKNCKFSAVLKQSIIIIIIFKILFLIFTFGINLIYIIKAKLYMIIKLNNIREN